MTGVFSASAIVALLDPLGIGAVDVIGISAGATSALELALRHPERVKHLAVLVGNLPGSPTAVVQPAWAKPLDRQLPIWLLKTLLPAVMTKLAGVPKSFAMTDDDARFVAEFIDSMFPLTPRVGGVVFDAFVSNAEVNTCDLEASRRAAERIPGARFLSLESGGHLMLGQTTVTRDELADFFNDANRETVNRPGPGRA